MAENTKPYTEQANIFCQLAGSPIYVLELLRTDKAFRGYTVEDWAVVRQGHNIVLSLHISTAANVRGVATDIKRALHPRVRAYEASTSL